MSNYVTVSDASTYLNAHHLNRDIWNDADATDQEISITMATRAIDRLAYKGEKVSFSQENEFPRGEQTTVPQDILDACCELAFAFIDGKEPEFEFDDLVVESKDFDKASIDFRPHADKRHIAAGIFSMEAWKLLRPHMRNFDSFRLWKV